MAQLEHVPYSTERDLGGTFREEKPRREGVGGISWWFHDGRTVFFKCVSMTRAEGKGATSPFRNNKPDCR